MIPTLLALLVLLASCQSTPTARVPFHPSPSIRGGVHMRENGAPLANHSLILMDDQGELLKTRTDKHGNFEFPRVPGARGTMHVRAAYAPGIRFKTNPLQTPLHGPGPHFGAFWVSTQIFRGIALDGSSGAPIANAQVKIFERNGPQEVCWTDAAGRFVTRNEYRATRLHVCSWDNPHNCRPGSSDVATVHRAHSEEGKHVPVRLEIGRRIDLDFSPPSGTDLSKYRVELKATGGSLGRHGWDSQKLRLNEGSTPWVRAPAALANLQDLELTLLLEDGSRAWVGRIPTSLDGSISMEPVSCGALTVLLTESPNAITHPVSSPSRRGAQGVTLRFVRSSQAGEPALRFERNVRVGSEFQINWMEPGLWSVSLNTPWFPEQEAGIQVPAGGTADLRLLLGARRPTAPLHIRLVDELGSIPEVTFGKDAPDYEALVTGPWGQKYNVETSAFCGVGIDAWFKRVRFEGQWVLEATLPELPIGDYTVRVKSRRRCLSAASLVVRPGTTATFRALKARTRGALGIEVIGPRGPHDTAYRLLGLNRRRDFALLEEPIFGGVHAYDVDLELPLEWCVIPRGPFQRVYGTRADFHGRDGGHWARVELTPGDSIRLTVLYRDGSPAAGFAVEFAGKSFTTDSRGRAYLVTREHPAARKLGLHGAALLGGDVNAEGRFMEGLPDLRVVLRSGPPD